jgi:hypothetical protein
VAATGELRTEQCIDGNGVTSSLLQGLCVFVVPERWAVPLSEPVKGIARGLEVLEILPLDGARRTAVARRLGRTHRFPAAAGAPHTLVVACDVPPVVPDDVADVEAESARLVAERIESVARHTTRRLWRDRPPVDDVVRHTVGPEAALDMLDLYGDPELRDRVLDRVETLGDVCTMPFPVIRMLGADSPGYRARVALVEHPRHGRSVCKIFRPGAMEFFRRELAARTLLADEPLVPHLLEHGPNWLLTPEYTDDGAHRLRRLPGVDGMHQLRPWATRALAGFARSLHDRGLFMLDLSPQNLMSDPTAGLKVLDLEFVMPYTNFAVPAPTAQGAWTYRALPPELAADIDLPRLILTRRAGNSVFHPAVAGLPIERLLAPARRGDGVRRVVTQLAWYAALSTAGRVHALLRRGR